MVPLEVEEQVGPNGGALSDRDVGVLDPRAGRLDHGLPQPSVPGAQEGNGEVTRGGRGHRGEQGGEGQHLEVLFGSWGRHLINIFWHNA